MDIIFRDRKMERICTNYSLSIRKYGPIRAGLLRRRIDDLEAAKNLEVLRSFPQTRCHELVGDRAGTLAVDLGHPYRLIFEPANDPIPRKPDGGLDWMAVTVVRILAVEDYHG